MPRIIGFALVLIASLAFSPAQAATASEAALAMVEKLQLGENISAISLRVAATTPAYRNLVSALGQNRALVLVRDEINSVRPKYQAQWDRNLAASYAELFTVPELESYAYAGKDSTYAAKFRARRGEVSRNMQAKSADLLNGLVAEVLKNAIARSIPGKK